MDTEGQKIETGRVPGGAANGHGETGLGDRPLVEVSVAVKPPVVRSSNSPMAEAIKNEIVRLCEIGDEKSGGIFTHNVALRIERVVKAGRELLLAERLSAMDAEKLLKAKLRRRLKSPAMSSVMNAQYMESLDDDLVGDEELGDLFNGDPIAQSSAVENFGMKAINEVVNAARAANNTPQRIVEAIAAAKKLGQTELAVRLEEKLFVDESYDPAKRTTLVAALEAAAPLLPAAGPMEKIGVVG